MDRHIDKYRVKGKVYTWEYSQNNRSYPGWNFTADKEACNSLIILLGLMDSSFYSSYKTIQTFQPTEKQVHVANRGSGFKAKQRLTIKYRKDASNVWQLESKGDDLVIEFGTERIEELQATLLKVKKGRAILLLPITRMRTFYIFGGTWRSEIAVPYNNV